MPLVVERTMLWDAWGPTAATPRTPSRSLRRAGSSPRASRPLRYLHPDRQRRGDADHRDAHVPGRRRHTVRRHHPGRRVRAPDGICGRLPGVAGAGVRDRRRGRAPGHRRAPCPFASQPGRLWAGGRVVNTGVVTPSRSSFHAEGATGGYFSTFILLGNPQSAPRCRSRISIQITRPPDRTPPSAPTAVRQGSYHVTPPSFRPPAGRSLADR